MNRLPAAHSNLSFVSDIFICLSSHVLRALTYVYRNVFNSLLFPFKSPAACVYLAPLLQSSHTARILSKMSLTFGGVEEADFSKTHLIGFTLGGIRNKNETETNCF